jgi:hypothetical protein
MPERIPILLQSQMRVDRLHRERDDDDRRGRQADDRGEADVPVPVVGEKQASRNAEHLACGECRLNKPHHTAAQMQRKQVGDDGEHDRADHAAKQSSHDPAKQ